MWKGSFSLVPKVVIREDEIDIKNIEELADIYSSVIPSTKLELVTETKRWVEIVKNTGQAEVPSSIVESLKLCHNLRTYPNIEALLKILATLPVITCTAERSFRVDSHCTASHVPVTARSSIVQCISIQAFTLAVHGTCRASTYLRMT